MRKNILKSLYKRLFVIKIAYEMHRVISRDTANERVHAVADGAAAPSHIKQCGGDGRQRQFAVARPTIPQPRPPGIPRKELLQLQNRSGRQMLMPVSMREGSTFGTSAMSKQPAARVIRISTLYYIILYYTIL